MFPAVALTTAIAAAELDSYVILVSAVPQALVAMAACAKGLKSMSVEP